MRTDDEVTALIEAGAPGMKHAACAIIFGNSLPEPAVLAANLFHRGLVRHLVLTGGPRRNDPNHVEADRHLEILLDVGVPRERVIVERRSQSATENAAFASPLIRASIGAPRTIIAVVLWYHRRALLALADALPELKRIFTATYEPIIEGERISRAGWPKTARAAKLRAEAERLANWSLDDLATLERTDAGWLVRSPVTGGDAKAGTILRDGYL